MALFSCNGCGSDETYPHIGYCASCAYERDLITDEEYDEMTAEET